MENIPSNDVQTHSAEAEGVTEQEMPQEQSQVPQNQSRVAGGTWKSTLSARGFRGEIREFDDGKIEWKERNTWGKFDIPQHDLNIH